MLLIMDLSTQVPFKHLCKLFEMMSSSKKPKHRKLILEKWISAYRSKTKNYFPVIRLLAPECDLDRVYGIKERTLANLILDVYNISKQGSDGKRLLHWREGEGDLPSVIYSLILARSTSDNKWFLSDVNHFLDKLSETKSYAEKLTIFRGIVSKLDATGVKWLSMIILKKLRYGTSLFPLLETFLPGASEIYTYKANLKYLCQRINSESFDFEQEKALELFVPFQPMLSARNKPLDIPLKMEPPYFVETKYDGERVLIHVHKRQIKIFSRYLRESTTLYMKALPEIKFSLKKTVGSCILDAELVVWDEERECIESFGGVRAISKAGEKEDGKHYLFKVFDILYLNGNSLLEFPLFERKQKLYNSIQETSNRVEIVEHSECETIEEVTELFREANDKREEGIVVKNPRSPYIPNARRKDIWVKVKPDFISNIASDLDVVILGGYYGEGKKTVGKIYSYIIGARSEDSSCYYPIGKVATGLTERERSFLLDELKDSWTFDCPINVLPDTYDNPDVWINPEDSLVLEVRAMQVIECDKRLAGITFRCPRIEKIRLDKMTSDCASLKNLRELIRSEAKIDESGFKSISKRSRKKVYVPLTRPTDVSSVDVKSSLFAGKVFYLCGGAWQKEFREDIEKKIYQYGGKFHQNYSPSVNIIIADKMSTTLKSLIEQEKHNRSILVQKRNGDIKYETKRVTDLKAICRQRRLKVSGRKSELILRLEEFDQILKPTLIVRTNYLEDCINQNKMIEPNLDNSWLS
jgi:DNA ligase-4